MGRTSDRHDTGQIREAPDRAVNYTYMLECSDGTLYTGWTNDIEKRIKSHNAGTGGKYNSTRRPVRLVYYEIYETREEAMSREYHIKHDLTRQQKLDLIKNWKRP